MEGREAVVGSAREGKKLQILTKQADFSDGILRGGTLSTFLGPTGECCILVLRRNRPPFVLQFSN